MAQNISIDVDINTLENKTSIIGNIYFTIDYHRFFPDYDWSDFVVIVLSWWIKSVKGLIVSKPNRTYEFDFMDGTPIVFAKKIDEDNVKLSFCVDTLEKRIVELEAICSMRQLRNSLIKVSNKVIRATKREKWNSEDIENLEDLVVSLERSPLS